MLHNTWIMFEYSILTSSGSLVELFLNICIVSTATSHQSPGNGPPQVRPGHQPGLGAGEQIVRIYTGTVRQSGAQPVHHTHMMETSDC